MIDFTVTLFACVRSAIRSISSFLVIVAIGYLTCRKEQIGN
jgi:hypothetical protein